MCRFESSNFNARCHLIRQKTPSPLNRGHHTNCITLRQSIDYELLHNYKHSKRKRLSKLWTLLAHTNSHTRAHTNIHNLLNIFVETKTCAKYFAGRSYCQVNFWKHIVSHNLPLFNLTLGTLRMHNQLFLQENPPAMLVCAGERRTCVCFGFSHFGLSNYLCFAVNGPQPLFFFAGLHVPLASGSLKHARSARLCLGGSFGRSSVFWWEWIWVRSISINLVIRHCAALRSMHVWLFCSVDYEMPATQIPAMAK